METNLNDKIEDDYYRLEIEQQLKEKDKPENQVCGLCGSKEIETEKDVGSDVNEGGEETQHIDRCKKCGAWRFNIDRWENFTDYKKCYGKWSQRND